jgi:hypothetical protein
VQVQLQLRIVGNDGTVLTDAEILRLDKSDERLETLGLSLAEAKTLQERLQRQVVAAQAARPTSTATAGVLPAAAG